MITRQEIFKYVDQKKKTVYQLYVINGVLYEDIFFANVNNGFIRKIPLKNKNDRDTILRKMHDSSGM